MAAKPENTFIASVHRKFGGASPYFEKMYNPLRSGTPDVYYSGDIGQLWVEYKFLPKTPRITRTSRITEILPELTPLQRRWLDHRYLEGRNVAVILGTPDGGVIYRDQEWNTPLPITELTARIVSREAVAQWITSQVGVSKCLY
jgi:hypothetical protein